MVITELKVRIDVLLNSCTGAIDVIKLFNEYCCMKDKLSRLTAFWEWSRLADKQRFEDDYRAMLRKGTKDGQK
jgi:hypothetical protein